MAASIAGARLAYYRLYMLNDPDGHFVGFEEIDAADDVEAVRIARSRVGARPLELWCGKRKVKNFACAAPLGDSQLV
jgi:hypothetical protein